jgi:hypothetical protein
MRLAAVLGVTLVLAIAAGAVAQNGGTSAANVTIQLPNFSVFGVNTSVLVPDSGPSPYAAQRQAFYSRVMYGRGSPQRAIGAQRSAAVAAATAQVHDFRESEASLLQAARSRRTNWVRGSTNSQARLADVADPRLLSVAEIERRRAEPVPDNSAEAEALLAKARQAEAAGKPKVAAIYYQMAAKRAGNTPKGEVPARSQAHETIARKPAAP